MAHDSLGDRMKQQYEDRTRYFLPRRTYTILRLDGKAFHTFTRGCEKPYDQGLIDRFARAAMRLCEEAQGAQFAYLQSDECSVLLTDFAQPMTASWFDSNLQKLVSVASSIFTAGFSHERATFDCRAFTIPDRVEVENYFIWRQKDWYRNSVQMMAQALYSQKELHMKGIPEMHEMIHAKGQNWAKLPEHLKNGLLVVRNDGAFGPTPAFEFTKARPELSAMIPNHGYDMEPRP